MMEDIQKIVGKTWLILLQDSEIWTKRKRLIPSSGQNRVSNGDDDDEQHYILSRVDITAQTLNSTQETNSVSSFQQTNGTVVLETHRNVKKISAVKEYDFNFLNWFIVWHKKPIVDQSVFFFQLGILEPYWKYKEYRTPIWNYVNRRIWCNMHYVTQKISQKSFR